MHISLVLKDLGSTMDDKEILLCSLACVLVIGLYLVSLAVDQKNTGWLTNG